MMTKYRPLSRRSILINKSIRKALFIKYESIYDIDIETSEYQCYHESKSFREMKMESQGSDFFAALSGIISKLIYKDDQEYVAKMLDRDLMLSTLQKEKYYSFVYRLIKDGEPRYYKIRATTGIIGGKPHIFLGVRDVDELMRKEQMHLDELASMHQKRKNHMEAILGSAAGYLEVNLTRDEVIEITRFLVSSDGSATAEVPSSEGRLRYSFFKDWLCREQIIENAERYSVIGSVEYLTECFEKGEKRASVSFSLKKGENGTLPCKELFYLYRDNASGDIMSFCVIYDLTEHQRREKERQELERELQMSRIRNFTSQMQPHFLYNALGSIQEIVLDDPEYASDLIGDFTVHLRSCIRAMASDRLIPFDQEIANIRAYVNIEKMRFGEKLRVVYDFKKTDFQILPLSIQPLVENAIRHGIYQRGAEGGTVTVRSREQSDAWIVEVEDDGVGFDVEQSHRESASGKKDSTGLKNLIFRLDKVMNADVCIRSEIGKGTKVTVSIPKGGSINEGDNC